MYDYITIRGRRYRVEVDWNALTAFLSATGAGVEVLAREITMPEWALLLVESVREGQRLDGSEETLTPQSFGELRPVEAIKAVQDFIPIYLKQSAASPESEAEDGKKE